MGGAGNNRLSGVRGMGEWERREGERGEIHVGG